MKKFLVLTYLIPTIIFAVVHNSKPEDIIDIRTILPGVKQDIRYMTKRNFLGTEVDGYINPRCFLQKPTAKALLNVQRDLKKKNLELIIYDCYRPQMAVNHFIRWAKDLNAKEMKSIFYPEVPKSQLFSRGYIASRSGHSKGNTIDLGLILKGSPIAPITSLPLNDCRSSLNEHEISVGLIDMGTHYDCFDELSHTMNSDVTKMAHENRVLLKKVMENNGFRNYSKEWWHYSFKKNKYPSTFHNFPVE